MTDIDRRHMVVAGLGATALTAAGPRVAEAATKAGQPLTPVTEFGVTPDAGADQTAQIQNALEEAAASRTPLYFPAGAYRCTQLALRPDTHLVGVHGRSVLIHEGSGPFVTAEVADNVRLTGLVLDGGRRPLGQSEHHRGLFVAKDCRTLSISACTFTDSSAHGVALRRCAGAVTDCSFGDIAGTGLFSLDARGLAIGHNHMSDCGDNGIQVWRSEPGEDGAIIVHNRIERIRADSGGSGQNGNGIVLFRAGSALVQGNRISDCAFSAIRANAASNVQMIGNSCARLGEVALYAEFGFEGAIIANNLVERAAAGISVTNFKDHGGRLAIVQGNLIRTLFFKEDSEDKRGFGIAVEADGIISGNIVEDAPHLGIALGWGAAMRDLSATGNMIRKARIGIGISVHSEAGYGFVTNNLIAGAKDGAIRAMDHAKPLGPDLATSSSESYRNIAVFGNAAT